MLFSDDERRFSGAISRLIYCNPFLPERIEYEREALGASFVSSGTLWHVSGSPRGTPNILALKERVEVLVEHLAARLVEGVRPKADDVELYADVVLYHLFSRYEEDLYALIDEDRRAPAPADFFDEFRKTARRLLQIPPATSVADRDVAHLFAVLFQIRRAFHYIFRNIRGTSMPVIRLRAAVWQSIFTRDMRRYRRAVFERMGDIATLISGPSGTGKELVARAIGLARYIPFDAASRTFTEHFAGSFYALNLSALSPTLIESELFGHRRGAFTGAVQDRAGWLEMCPPLGTVFLDEIGELDPAIQVKLLRVLQTRAFQRLGDTRDRHFAGKILAATNRDLAEEMRAGRFREDLYYRLCSDLIFTPSLEERLRDAPDERRTLLRFIAERVVGEAEGERLAAEADAWIDAELGDDYRWPGNVRELEQCVRNVMIRGAYQPARTNPPPVQQHLAEGFLTGSWTAEEMLRRYCTLTYAQTGSYQETGRRLGLDRRTIREKIDPRLLAELRGGLRLPGRRTPRTRPPRNA